ncbi:MAG: glycerate kinase [Deltaproteobacteria bacterium]|nr:glycerate kinase [Deltaproteobacteria bacterium]
MDLSAGLRSDARTIFSAALAAVDPAAALKRQVTRVGDRLQIAGRWIDLAQVGHISAVGAGKASAGMALAIEAILADKVPEGLVIVKDGYGQATSKIRVVEAGHPVPDARGVDAANEIIEMVRAAGPDDLVLCLLSGGGSALLSAPAEDISLADKQRATELLLRCGATIQEINAIRKHASQIKGGQLARLARPARLVSLIVSDVIGDPLDAIASGPTAPDPTTFADCLAVIDRYSLRQAMPAALITRFEAGQRGQIDETPKPGDAVFAGVQNVIVGNNREAVLAAEQKAVALGYRTLVLSEPVQGEAAQAGLAYAALCQKVAATGAPVERPACVLSGGETTVTVRGHGRGGRNQEFATAAATAIAGLPNVVILSGGTDGGDGPTDAAGAIVDGATIARGKALGLDVASFLANNDTYHYLKAVDELLITGPTLTNVMDVQVMLIG